MALPLNHFVDTDPLGGNRHRATVYSYPRYHRDGDPETGTLRETDCSLVPSDHPAVSDWMAKRGVWSLYARNDGTVAYKHLERALTVELTALVVVKADRTFEVIAQANHAAPAVDSDKLVWTDVFPTIPGVDRTVHAVPDQFRDVMEISATAREQIGQWLLAHGYGGKLDQCFVAFASRLTPHNLDGESPFNFVMEDDGGEFSQGDDRETTGPIRFRVAGRVKQFIPPGEFYTPDAEPDEDLQLPSTPKRKRLFRHNGDWWFLEGARCDQLAALPPGRVVANTTVTFQEGQDAYAGTESFGMFMGNTDKTYRDNGAYHALWAGGWWAAAGAYRGGLRFDVSSIPATATVTTATVALTFVLESVATNYLVYLYHQLKDWNEPSADNHPASDVNDEPCWDYQYYDETAWGTAGAAGEDVDRNTDVVASATVTGLNTGIDFQSESIDALVEDWIDGTLPNYGFQVAGDESTNSTTKMWAMKAHGTAAYRPKLVIIYTVPTALPVLDRYYRNRRCT